MNSVDENSEATRRERLLATRWQEICSELGRLGEQGSDEKVAARIRCLTDEIEFMIVREFDGVEEVGRKWRSTVDVLLDESDDLFDDRQKMVLLATTAEFLRQMGERLAAEEYFRAAISLAETLHEDQIKSRNLRILGEMLRRSGCLDEASVCQQESLEIALKLSDPEEEAYARNNLAIIYFERGDLRQAKGEYDRAAALAEAHGFSRLLGHIYNNTGVYYLVRGDYETASTLFGRALIERERAGDADGLAETWHNLGMMAEDVKDYMQAGEYYERAFTIARRIGNRVVLANVMIARVSLYIELNDFEIAQFYARYALRELLRLGDRLGLADIMKLIGVILRRQGHLQVAREYLERSIVICREVGSRLGIAEGAFELARSIDGEMAAEEPRKMAEESRRHFSALGAVEDLRKIEEFLESFNS